MNMPASHNCCHIDIQAGHLDAVQAGSAAYHVAIAPISELPAIASGTHMPLIYQPPDAPQHSPPGSPPPVASVLRI
jgi:hypothetical protein